MLKRSGSIMTISYLLALLYAVSFFYYLTSAVISVIFHSALAVSVMCLILFCGAVALAVGRPWGRLVLVYGNILFFIIGIWVVLLFPEMISVAPFDEAIFLKSLFLGSLFFAAVIALYFAQYHIRLMIHPELKYLRKCILVVDDDEGIQRTLKRLLLPIGYSVLAATSGERGLQVAKSQHPDLIVLDVILPGLKGRDVCRRLKEDPETREIPVLFLTAKDSPDDIQAEMEAGGAAHITKPIHARSMIAKIKELLHTS